MKKFVALLIAIVMLFALTACGTPKPEPVVKSFCEAMKSFDVESMQTYLIDAEGADVEGDIEDDGSFPDSIWDYVKKNAETINYTVNDAKINEDKATVIVDFTYTDAYDIMAKAFGDYFTAAFAAAFSEDVSDEELMTILASSFDNSAKSAEPKTDTKSVEFNCVLKDGKWFISEMPEGIDDVMTSNVLVPLKEFGEDEELNEADYNWDDITPGTEVVLSDMKLTVLECTETDTLSNDWDSVTADEGTKFVRFKVQVENTTNDSLEFSAPDFYDNQGRHYKEYEDATWYSEDEFCYTELAPNMPKTGYCTYNVPEDSTNYYLAIVNNGTDNAYKLFGE